MWTTLERNVNSMRHAIPAPLKHPNSLCTLWAKKKWLLLRKYCVNSIETLNETAGKYASVEADFLCGKTMYFESGRLARMAHGCATVTFKDTTMMAAVVSVPAQEITNFTQLNIIYKQKAAALGRIPLTFTRRDRELSENEILTARVIDRSVRPLFPKYFNEEVQITCNPLALDGSTYPDILAINAASAALAVSHIDWDGPVGAIRVGLCDDEVIINPSKSELTCSSLDLIVTAMKDKLIVMLEGYGANVSLNDLLKCIKRGVKECQIIVKAIVSLREKSGKEKKQFHGVNFNSEIVEEIQKLGEHHLREVFRNHNQSKLSRDSSFKDIGDNIYQELKVKYNDNELKNWKEIYENLCRKIFREETLNNDLRCDGRTEDEMRPINCQVDLFKPLHGSALFQRGQTQVLCTVALDSPNSALKMDNITMLTNGIKEKNFFVHYEFPSYSTRQLQTRKSRREIGHGALAEKALKANIPSGFPFTIRLTSEVLESNGSSSMATVCGGSLALMDAGIPLEVASAGVAMGIVTKYSEKIPNDIENHKILTDIMGAEDYFGDMDFKIGGTKKAITAVQLDMKIKGLPITIISEALSRGKSAISNIINVMHSVCPGSRIEKKANWPAIKKLTIPHHARSKFLGLGGMNVKKLEVESGVEISEGNFGEFTVFASNKEVLEEAMVKVNEILENLQTPTLEFGGVYKATVVEIKDHGVMVTLYPSMQPVLIHITQLDHRKIQHPSALGIKEGDELSVKYFGRDPVSGVMRLSRKVIQNTASEVVRSFTKVKSDEEMNAEVSEQRKEEAA